MIIDEIISVTSGGINLANIARDGEQPFGFNDEIDSYEFMKNKASGGHVVYYLIDGDNIIAAVVCWPTSLQGVNYLKTIGVYVRSEYRGQDLALKMYHSIKHGENMNLMSDSRQTRDGEIIWDKLADTFTVAVINTTTGEKVSDRMADAYDDSEDLVLVTETKFVAESLIIPYLKIGKNSKGFL